MEPNALSKKNTNTTKICIRPLKHFHIQEYNFYLKMSCKLLQILQYLILLTFKSHLPLALPHSQLESLGGPREDAAYSWVLINCFHTNLTCKLSILLPTPCPGEKVRSLWFRAKVQALHGPDSLTNVQSKCSDHIWINRAEHSLAPYILMKELLSRALSIMVSGCLSIENTLYPYSILWGHEIKLESSF